jgi:hypothetical protein
MSPARFRPKLFCRRGTAKLPLLLFPLQGVRGFALGIGADTGLAPNALCAYERKARAEGNAIGKEAGHLESRHKTRRIAFNKLRLTRLLLS